MPGIDSGGQGPALGPPTLDFSVVLDSAARTIRLCGELDVETACLFAGVIAAQAAQDHVRLTVDVAELTFFDVPGFAALVAADDALRRRGGALAVVGYSPLFARVAQIIGTAHLLADPEAAPPTP